MTTRVQLQSKTIDELRQIADAVGVETDGLQKSKLISALVDAGQVADSSAAEEVDLPQATPRTERVAQDGESDSDQGAGDGPRPESRQGGRPDYDDRQGGSRNRNRRRRGGGRPRGRVHPRKDLETREGLLDILPEGYGFLRVTGYLSGDKDVYVSANQVRKFRLRKGDIVSGPIRPPRSKEKFPAVVRIDKVNGMTADEAMNDPSSSRSLRCFPMRDSVSRSTEGRTASSPGSST